MNHTGRAERIQGRGRGTSFFSSGSAVLLGCVRGYLWMYYRGYYRAIACLFAVSADYGGNYDTTSVSGNPAAFSLSLSPDLAVPALSGLPEVSTSSCGRPGLGGSCLTPLPVLAVLPACAACLYPRLNQSGGPLSYVKQENIMAHCTGWLFFHCSAIRPP